MGGGIVIAGYWRADYAMMHARCLTGCTVSALDLDKLAPALRAIVESQILDDLPSDIRGDLEIAEWADEDVTPKVEVTLDELEDQISNGVPAPVADSIQESSLAIPINDPDDKESR